jgi:hypothetical protein
MDWNRMFAPYEAVKAKWETDETFRKLGRFIASVVVTALAGWAMDLPPKQVALVVAGSTGLLINAGNFTPKP